MTADGSGYVKNALGLTEGGIQLPQVVVPTGVLDGARTTVAGTCSLAGSFTIFSAEKLASLYPTHQAYVAKYTAAVKRSVKQGFVQPYDASVSVAQAQDSAIPAVTDVP